MSSTNSDTLTFEVIRNAMRGLRDNKRIDQCPPHLVHPMYVGWVLADLGDAEAIVRCANLCGWVAPMRPR